MRARHTAGPLPCSSVWRTKKRSSALLLAYSPRLRAILERSRVHIGDGEKVNHEEFGPTPSHPRRAIARGPSRRRGEADRKPDWRLSAGIFLGSRWPDGRPGCLPLVPPIPQCVGEH